MKMFYSMFYSSFTSQEFAKVYIFVLSMLFLVTPVVICLYIYLVLIISYIVTVKNDYSPVLHFFPLLRYREIRWRTNLL